MSREAKEDLVEVLNTMKLVTGLCRTEIESLSKAANYISENDNVEFASKILTMIANGASNDDIKNFCETYIQSKEEKR